ncbi:MAG: DUF1343 domain-containing protein [Calditrichia bacterium]
MNELPVKAGLDVLAADNFRQLQNKNIALLCHQASVDSQFHHILDLLVPLHKNKSLHITAVFGPQHGLWGHTQDNMIEWEGYSEQGSGIPVYSLYGKLRKPSPEMLKECELLIVDLQDVGARYYTFIWTMALCMEACSELGITVMVLDRPNPLSGHFTEGTVLQQEFSSFVGLYPLPLRHGMTIGEIARYLQGRYFPELNLEIIEIQNWHREYFFPACKLPWILPSPNIPCWESTLVYPGMCLLEGTNLSEGRGTTRPFEFFGAPWINGRKMADELNFLDLPGVWFRPVQFQPTFQKYAGEICEGCFIHVTDPMVFRPVLSAVALLQQIFKLRLRQFRWNPPPYEYEYEKLPFDILAGNGWLRQMIENQADLKEISGQFKIELQAFEPLRNRYLIYRE